VRQLNPIGDDELEHLFAFLSHWPVWLIAVSGGPDSLALMYLIARWQRISRATAIVSVATVDHSIRPTSAAEANFVAAQAHSLGLPHVTLPWLGVKPTGGMLNAARVARYDLLIKHLAKLPGSPRALVTAHHQDDQAETVLMRLSRGSGVDGLSAMAPVRLLDNDSEISLIRPLLDIPKARLEDTLRARHQTWIDDPTNTDLSTERARLRQHATSNLPPAALARTARRMAQARHALEHATSQLEAQITYSVPGVTCTTAREPFTQAPIELRVRLLARALSQCGGIHPPATRAEIEALVERLETAVGVSTLGGCRIDPTRTEIIICREAGRLGLPPIQLQPGETLNWDDRFQVSLAPSATQTCDVRTLTHDEWPKLKKMIPLACTLTTPAALTIPSFWVNGELVALPCLGYEAPMPPGQSSKYHAQPHPKTRRATLWHGPNSGRSAR
jgi:tRNA(Ile)-lysidine synthase